MEIVRRDGRGTLIGPYSPSSCGAITSRDRLLRLMSAAFRAINMILCERGCRGIKRGITEHVNKEVMNSDFIAKQL